MRLLRVLCLLGLLVCLVRSTDEKTEPSTSSTPKDSTSVPPPNNQEADSAEDKSQAVVPGETATDVSKNETAAPESFGDSDVVQDYEEDDDVGLDDDDIDDYVDVPQRDMAAAEDRAGYAPLHGGKIVPAHLPAHAPAYGLAHGHAHKPAHGPPHGLAHGPTHRPTYGPPVVPKGHHVVVNVPAPVVKVHIGRPKQKKLTTEQKRLLPVRCNRNLRYRTYDGSCNNLNYACWGRSGESYGRLLKPMYGDGRGQPRTGEYGRHLPNPRLLSLVITGEGYQTSDTTYTQHSDIVTHFGQLIAHDITFAGEFSEETVVNGVVKQKPPSCCKGGGHKEGCASIMINHSDDFYPTGHCIEVVRSGFYNSSRTSCSKNSPGLYREQLNTVTSFIDGSCMYGSDTESSRKLRSENGKGAKLEVDKSSLYIPKGLLPRVNEGECFSFLPGCDNKCFHAGDKRASLTPMIASLQTLFAREHNHIADELKKKGWPNEKVYQVARKIVGACLQVIAYKEYLPRILGPRMMEAYKLSIPTAHYYYNHSLNPSLLNEFASGANRLPHAAVGSKFHREGQKCYHTSRTSYDLNTMDDFCKPKSDPIRALLMGACYHNMQQQDTLYSKEITRFLFASPPNQYGKDLLAMDIVRGRDHGLPPYGYFRKLCGLRPIYSFDEFKKESKSVDIVNKLKTVYGNYFEDLDLIVGLILEKPVHGSMYGPTTVCIMGEQYYRLKYADRFWFENLYHPGAFNKEQIKDISKITLATLICKNTDVDYMHPNVFRMPGKGNEKRSCKSIIAQSDYNYNLYK